jgi:hypothetical protein
MDKSIAEVLRVKGAARQIVGFSLPPHIAIEVKKEAARRNLSLRELFIEIWTLYKKTKST